LATPAGAAKGAHSGTHRVPNAILFTGYNATCAASSDTWQSGVAASADEAVERENARAIQVKVLI
jgi:hypothetical protein